MRRSGPRTPRSARGNPGQGMAMVTPTSLRANASTPIPSRMAQATAVTPSPAHCDCPASGTWSAVHENQVDPAIASNAGTTVR